MRKESSKSCHITSRVTPEEKKEITEYCEAHDLTYSELFRQKVLKAVRCGR